MKFPKYEPPLEATPGSLFRLAAAGIGAVADLITGGPPATVAQIFIFDDVFDRITEVQTVLGELKSRGALITAVTHSRYYRDMVINRVSLPRTEAGGAAFQIGLRQIRHISSATVQAPKPEELRGEAAKKMGAQKPKPVKGTDAAKGQSIADKILTEYAPGVADWLAK
jgi:hypothetical protein